jgi:4,4'-diaponeurosporenoate glycosyltransferase
MEWGFFAASVAVLWGLGFWILWRIPQFEEARLPGGSATMSFVETPVSISVIVPARNEEKKLPALLRSLNRQSLKPMETIVVDDASTDATARLASDLGAVVVTSQEPPKGWLGKTWACWQGAQRAKAEILVFLDADTALESRGLERIAGTHRKRGGLVSVWPFHRMKRLYERLSAFLNIIVIASMNAFTPLGERLKPLGAFGPCIVCSRTEYFAVGGHRSVKASILDDVALGMRFLERGINVHLYGGKGAVAFRMYPEGVRSIISGFGKNMGSGFRAASIVPLILITGWLTGAFVVTFFLAFSIAGSNFAGALLWFVADLMYAAQIYWILSRLGNFGFYTAFFFQVPLLFFVGVFIHSVVCTFLSGKVFWKGRRISLER